MEFDCVRFLAADALGRICEKTELRTFHRALPGASAHKCGGGLRLRKRQGSPRDVGI